MNKQPECFLSFLLLELNVLVLVALPETGFQSLQPCLALLRCSGETLCSHLVGYYGENVSGSVHSSQLLLKLVFAPRYDEGQRLHVCPWNTSSPLNQIMSGIFWLLPFLAYVDTQARDEIKDTQSQISKMDNNY